MTVIKICGIRRYEDIDILNQLRPDYAGFVFAKSPKEISDDLALSLRERILPSIKTVGVFVNEDLKRIVKLCQSQTIDMVQLHGDEDENYIKTLRTLLPNQIIKAIRVKSKETIKEAIDYKSDYLLLDSHSDNKYGGSGRVFDWSLIDKLEQPFFLAGGLDCDNVLEAIRSCKPYGVDVSSGVETDGYKDPDKIREFIRKIKGERV
jgi:phosphoribosylanthranilate isomerase